MTGKRTKFGERLIKSATEAASIARREMKSPRVTTRSIFTRGSGASDRAAFDVAKAKTRRGEVE